MGQGRKPDPREQYKSLQTPGFCPPPRNCGCCCSGLHSTSRRQKAKGRKPGPMSRSRLSAQPHFGDVARALGKHTDGQVCQWGEPLLSEKSGFDVSIVNPTAVSHSGAGACGESFLNTNAGTRPADSDSEPTARCPLKLSSRHAPAQGTP